MCWFGVLDGKLKNHDEETSVNGDNYLEMDYWFWSAAMAEVRRIQPKSLDELKDCVEEYVISLSVYDFLFRTKYCSENWRPIRISPKEAEGKEI